MTKKQNNGIIVLKFLCNERGADKVRKTWIIAPSAGFDSTTTWSARELLPENAQKMYGLAFEPSVPIFLLPGLLAIQAVLSQPQSQCMQDLAQNEDFMRCSQSFASLVQEMQTSGAAQSGDVAQIYAAFCT